MTGDRGCEKDVVEGDCGIIEPSCDIRVERASVADRGTLPGVEGVTDELVRLSDARIDGEIARVEPCSGVGLTSSIEAGVPVVAGDGVRRGVDAGLAESEVGVEFGSKGTGGGTMALLGGVNGRDDA